MTLYHLTPAFRTNKLSQVKTEFLWKKRYHHCRIMSSLIYTKFALFPRTDPWIHRLFAITEK